MVHESNRSAQTSAETFDPTMLDDLVWGVQQLLFNNQTNRMVDAYEIFLSYRLPELISLSA